MRYFLLLLNIFLGSLAVFSSVPNETSTPFKAIKGYTFNYYLDGINDDSETFTCAFQDNHGYMWFASTYGISKFNGNKSIYYPYTEKQESTFDALYFFQHNDTMGVVTTKGISLILPDNHIRFFPLPNNHSNHTTCCYSNGYVYLFNAALNIPADSERDIEHWVNIRFSLQTLLFEFWEKPHPYYSEPYISNDTVWIPAVNRIETIVKDRIIQTTGLDRRYNKIFQLDKNNLLGWEKHTGALYKISYWRTGQPLEIFQMTIDSPLYMKGLQDGRVLFTYAKQNKNLYLIEKGDISKINTDMPDIKGIFPDHHNNMWICTDKGMYNFFQLLFETYDFSALGDNFGVQTIEQDSENDMWFSFPAKGTWKMNGSLQLSRVETSLPDDEYNYFTSSLKDKNNRIFFSHPYGICVWDNKQFTNFEIGNSIINFSDTLNGNIYGSILTKGNKAMVIISENLELQKFSTNQSLQSGILVKDGKGRIRLGKQYLWNGQNGFNEDTVSHPYNQILSAVSDRWKGVWKGTSNGLYHENPDGIETLIEKKITHSELFSALTNYRNQYLLYCSEKSVSIIDLNAFYEKGSLIIRHFSAMDGISIKNILPLRFCIDNEGYAWISTSKCVYRFSPERVMDIPNKSQILSPYISGIMISKDNTIWENPDNKENIILPYYFKSLKFEIANASVYYPDKLMFRYRMPGFTDGWSEPQESNIIIISNLPPGSYQLETQSSVDGISWSDSTFSHVPITIQKPYWSEFWFIALMIICVSGLFVLFLNKYNSYYRKKRNEEQEIGQLRLMSIRSRHIPHFTGNILSAINFYILKDKELASEYIANFSQFSQLTLLNAEKYSWSIQEEIEYTRLYLNLEKVRFSEKLDFNIQINESIDKSMQVPTMVLHTFCENAMKHGLRHKTSPGFINIRINKSGSYVVLSVSDNGIGREKAKLLGTTGTESGLKTLLNLFQIYNKYNKYNTYLEIIDLKDEKGNSTGTKFDLFIPQGFKFKIN